MNIEDIKQINYSQFSADSKELEAFSTENFDPEVQSRVLDIIDNVRKNGDTALFDYTKRFDGVDLSGTGMLVSPEEFAKAKAKLTDEQTQVYTQTIENIRDFHQNQLRENWQMYSDRGFTINERFVPIEKVGVYVPGGTAPLVSSVLMTALPAIVAGVKEIVICTPPAKDGTINPYILAAADMIGCTKVIKLGGAQAIAALAWGTKSVPAVDKICGPGNIYVATAKKLVFGKVGIDMVAGPSEVGIIADKTSDPVAVAADLLAQLEHDTLAKAYLVFAGNDEKSDKALQAIKKQVISQGKALSRQQILSVSIPNNLIVIQTQTTDQAVEVTDFIAPEHLEVLCAGYQQICQRIKNCSAIFAGPHTCVSLGDFWAGPSHVLPTGRSARFSSGLSVSDFIKIQNIIEFQPEGLEKSLKAIEFFGATEGLDGHANAVTKRAQRLK